MKIWKLAPIHNSIIGYPYVTNQEEVQFYLNLFSNKFYTEESALEYWQPTFACDLYMVDIGRLLQAGQEFWVLNEKARTALAPLLGDTVEYLPFLTKDTLHERFTKRQRKLRKMTIDAILQIIHPQQQYVVNVFDIKSSKIINTEQSEYDYDEEDDIIYGVEKLAFQPEKIKNTHLFKIKNPGIYFKSATFISDQFKTIVEENKLTGLKFSEEHEDDGGNLIWAKSTDNQ